MRIACRLAAGERPGSACGSSADAGAATAAFFVTAAIRGDAVHTADAITTDDCEAAN